MTMFRNVPLRQKLTWLAMICSVVALVTTAVSLGTYEWFVFRKNVFSQVATMASIVLAAASMRGRQS